MGGWGELGGPVIHSYVKGVEIFVVLQTLSYH